MKWLKDAQDSRRKEIYCNACGKKLKFDHGMLKEDVFTASFSLPALCSHVPSDNLLPQSSTEWNKYCCFSADLQLFPRSACQKRYLPHKGDRKSVV